jgi:hypothetical protein
VYVRPHLCTHITCAFLIGCDYIVGTLNVYDDPSGPQAEERRFWPTLQSIVKREGVSRLYAGALPLLLRAFVVHAVTFFA